MNKERRKSLAEAQVLFEAGMRQLIEAKSTLESCQEEEQEYLDNMPESLQNGEKGEQATTAIDTMQTLIDAIDEVDGAADWDSISA